MLVALALSIDAAAPKKSSAKKSNSTTSAKSIKREGNLHFLIFEHYIAIFIQATIKTYHPIWHNVKHTKLIQYN
jgi:hypothetical protein